MEYQSHWAESLQPGDRVKATIRHATDGTKNKHNIPVIVADVLCNRGEIIGWVEGGFIEIPFNELKPNG